MQVVPGPSWARSVHRHQAALRRCSSVCTGVRCVRGSVYMCAHPHPGTHSPGHRSPSPHRAGHRPPLTRASEIPPPGDPGAVPAALRVRLGNTRASFQPGWPLSLHSLRKLNLASSLSPRTPACGPAPPVTLAQSSQLQRGTCAPSAGTKRPRPACTPEEHQPGPPPRLSSEQTLGVPSIPRERTG